MTSPPLKKGDGKGASQQKPQRRRPGRPARADDDASHAEVRERLLVAATELAVERGIDGAGIREIADRAGVSSGMISYYFGDRQGLHEAMSLRAFEQLSQAFEKAVAEQSPDTNALDTLIHVHAAALSANPWLPRLVARDILEGGGGLFNELGAQPLQLMQKAIQAAIERGELRSDIDPVMCVLTIASTGAFPYLVAPMLVQHLGIELDDDFRDRLIAHNVDLITNGLRAPAHKEKL